MLLEAFLSRLGTLGASADSDRVDELHNFITSNVLIALGILVSYKQFGGKPIECLIPPKFPGSWEDYTEQYCWAEDNYFLPFDKAVPSDYKKREAGELSYYQWVPFFLLGQAASFRLPAILWQYLAGFAGVQLERVVRLTSHRRNVNPEHKDENLRCLQTHLANALRFHRRFEKREAIERNWSWAYAASRFFNLTFHSTYMSATYLFTKCLYLLNVCLQLHFLNWFLETDDGFYGFRAFWGLVQGVEWEASGLFPRVTVCDMDIRVMGNLQRYSVQCTLVINIFTEKIFVALWFWYAVLIVLTFASLIQWIILMTVPKFSRWFVSKRLELSDLVFDPKASAKELQRFTHTYLRRDGVFVLRMISEHSGIIVASELMAALWTSFKGVETQISIEQKRKQSEDEARRRNSTAPTSPRTNSTAHSPSPVQL